MKKTIILTFTLTAMLALAGCGKSACEQPLTVYSFHGANEQLTISNGVMVLSEGKDVFYGGDLKVNENFLSDITSFSTTFYFLSDNGDNIILSNSVVDQTGTRISVEGDLGKVSGDGAISRTIVDEDELVDLKNDLYFELTTTDKSGKENVYQLQMSVSEVLTESES